jgi:hypothetical protein
MSDNSGGGSEKAYGQIMSAFAENAKAAENVSLSPAPLGQRYPHQNPQHCPHPESRAQNEINDPLGKPMSIGEVAKALGCSTWTVRQRYLPLGLPHFRLAPAGKLLFFHNQIVRWVLEKQRQKGGMIR